MDPTVTGALIGAGGAAIQQDRQSIQLSGADLTGANLEAAAD
jgi:uncharacterized protein YjbI with pentapeptide repeats